MLFRCPGCGVYFHTRRYQVLEETLAKTQCVNVKCREWTVKLIRENYKYVIIRSHPNVTVPELTV